MPEFVPVTVVFDGKHYSVEVDQNAEYDELVTVLVDALAEHAGLDKTRNYDVALRGALRLKAGAVLEVAPSSGTGKIRNFRPA
ncbi:hypothetical protein [Micromonospora zhanjiangensis]|uniref:Uncharacterized protein n=1 Tax=Micromonospora zhanjiangensis TaxID=1522057 RepID=A0ABV8KSP0_9ACTN